MGSFTTEHWIVVAIIAFVIFKIVKGSSSPAGKTLFCKACGHDGASKTLVRGSMGIELVLWLCFLVPGLIYSIWRLSTKGAVCSQCGSAELVPPDSPIAQATKKQLGL